MIQDVVRVPLAVSEDLVIQKKRYGTAGKRLCVVTGTHGDELEGQYVAWRLSRILTEQPDQLDGIVDIYPALNPLGISTITRGMPLVDLDMNRTFPGSEDGSMSEYLAARIIEDMKGADCVIDIHASNIYLMEMPQVRLSEETADGLLPLARQLNMDFIWIYSSATVLESTLAYSLNSIGTPTLVVEMGVGMRITKAYGDNLIQGILFLMKNLGIWRGETEAPRQPIISTDGHVSFLNANEPGIFLPAAAHSDMVKEGEEIGIIVDPLTGDVCERMLSPVDGLLFTLREYPVVYEGSLVARILGGVK